MDQGDMSFSEALSCLKSDCKLQRKNWNKKSMFIFLNSGSKFFVNRAPLNTVFDEGSAIHHRPYISMMDSQGLMVPWVASQTDILADDWRVID